MYKYIFKNKFKPSKFKRFFCRDTILTKMFYKTAVLIYKGNIFTKILITKYNVGYKLGEFVLTRKPFCYPHKKKTKR